jgi:hypothetical protein
MLFSVYHTTRHYLAEDSYLNEPKFLVIMDLLKKYKNWHQGIAHTFSYMIDLDYITSETKSVFAW